MDYEKKFKELAKRIEKEAGVRKHFIHMFKEKYYGGVSSFFGYSRLVYSFNQGETFYTRSNGQQTSHEFGKLLDKMGVSYYDDGYSISIPPQQSWLYDG